MSKQVEFGEIDFEAIEYRNEYRHTKAVFAFVASLAWVWLPPPPSASEEDFVFWLFVMGACLSLFALALPAQFIRYKSRVIITGQGLILKRPLLKNVEIAYWEIGEVQVNGAAVREKRIEMRVGILSDIHGNIWALKAALDDAKRRAVERFINLGDILYGPLKPRDTFELLQTIDAVTIQGNQDRDVYQATAAQMENNPTLAYVINDLGSEPIDWLKSLPKTRTLADEIFACHGSPRSDMVYLLEDVTQGFPAVKAEEAIQKEIEGFGFPVILCGHTHIPRVVQLSSGSLVVNPGSVGVPAYDDDLPNYHAMQNYSPLASYAVVEKGEGGWRVELLKVPYEHSLAAEQARRQGREDWAKWIATGRAGA